MTYTVGTLFSGIGVPDLCARLLGMDTVWQVEKEAFPQAVLRKNFPEATLHGDIFDCHDLPYVDVIVAGFPCQPFSTAGEQRGDRDPRYLVPEMLRVIDEVRPRICLLENVPGFASLDDGKSFKQLLGALAEMGFDAEWGHIRASDVGAPHQRERWFCVGYTTSRVQQDECESHSTAQFQLDPAGRAIRWHSPCRVSNNGRPNACRLRIVGYARSQRSQGRWLPRRVRTQFVATHGTGNGSKRGKLGNPRTFGLSGNCLQCGGAEAERTNAGQRRSDRYGTELYLRTGSRSESAGRDVPQPRLGRNIDGFADRLDGFVPYPARPGMAQFEYEPRRVTARTPANAKRIKALGNSMAVDVVFEIMRAIKLWLEAQDGAA